MAGETTLTVIGNLTNDPELRFTPAGKAVANFTIASTPRTFKDGGWVDGETLFLRAAVWNEPAENVAESLTKGMRVIVSGRLKSRSYETKEGEKRTVMELEVDEIGPSLRYANAKVNRSQRGNQAQGNGNGYAPAQGGYNTQGANQPQGQQNAQQGGYGGQWGGNQQQPPQQQGGGPSGQWGTGADPGVNQGFQQGNQPSTPQQQQPQNDPWGAPTGQNPSQWGNGPVSDPPF